MSPGDSILRNTLSAARREANYCRRTGYAKDDFVRGMCVGRVGVVEWFVDHDPLLLLAVDNELRFLRDYARLA